MFQPPKYLAITVNRLIDADNQMFKLDVDYL